MAEVWGAKKSGWNPEDESPEKTAAWGREVRNPEVCMKAAGKWGREVRCMEDRNRPEAAETGGGKRCPEAEERMKAAENMGGSTVMLSGRLQMLAGMVTPGNRLVDVGCDHGYLAISLVSSGICPGAIAMDVREGPLAAAKAHIAESGLNDYRDVRFSDGLAACRPGEADTMVCAGMGGRLMERILRDGMEKAGRMRELVLQPQSELPQFRAFLRESGFDVIDEDAVIEDGKYYFAMKAVWGGADAARGSGRTLPNDGTVSPAAVETGIRRLYDLYGRQLLQGGHPVLLQYLRQRQCYVKKLEQSLMSAGTAKAQRRLEEVHHELEDIETALGICFGRQCRGCGSDSAGCDMDDTEKGISKGLK